MRQQPFTRTLFGKRNLFFYALAFTNALFVPMWLAIPNLVGIVAVQYVFNITEGF